MHNEKRAAVSNNEYLPPPATMLNHQLMTITAERDDLAKALREICHAIMDLEGYQIEYSTALKLSSALKSSRALLSKLGAGEG